SQLWKEATAGGRRVALLAGEPGIGKTRLAAELAGSVHAEGALVLAGRCDEDLGVPFQPFVEGLRHYAAHTSAPRLGRYGGELARLAPELARSTPDLAEPLRSDPETERYRLFDAVAAWLADISGETPTLLVLDDLHWAAKPTLLLLRHVLRSPEPLRLLVVATYRDSEVDRGHPLAELLADLPRIEGQLAGGGEPISVRFSLTGLDQAAVTAFIERAAGHALSEEDAALPRAVWTETEGNPFFVAEVLRHLRESGGIEHRAGMWVIATPVEQLGIPEGVRDVVGRRLSRLSEAAQQVLRVASIIGLEFEPAVVGVAGDIGESSLFSALEEAVGARLVSEVPGGGSRYRFAHALVRATLYDEITAARREALHGRVAETIESVHAGALDDYLPALSHHWARAPVHVTATGKAVHYTRRAGDRALAQLAHDEAVAYYHQALELLGREPGPDDDGLRLELLIALGDAQRRAGMPASRDTLLDAVALARARDDATALARAALANTRGVYWSTGGGVDHERVASLEAALTAVGEAPTAVRARLLATLGIELVWTADRARRVSLSDESLRIARSLGDAATLAHVLLTRAWTINAADTLAERITNTDELVGLAEGLGDPFVEFVANFMRARVTLETGEIEAGEPHLRRARALAAELGQPMLRFMVGWVRVGSLLLAGRIDEADRAARDAFELGHASGQPDAGLIFVLQRSVIRFEQDRLGELVPELSEMRAGSPAVPGVAALLAAAHCQLGHLDTARSCFGPLVTMGFELPRDPLWLALLTVAADVARQLDDQSSARTLYELLRPYPAAFPVVASASTGCTAHSLGMLAAMVGSYAAAEDHFRVGLATCERQGARVGLARTQLEWARMLLRRDGPGDAGQARELLLAALDSARNFGLTGIERDAAALLA
ncbi:MAG: ATP-binding protein, partial [Acidimicrobiia bacterium]